MFFFSREDGFVMQIVKGVITVVLFTLVSVLLFAFILNAFNLSNKVIRPINQLIKTSSLVFACFFAIRNCKFLLKGGLIGLLSALFTVLIFTLISGVSFSFLTVAIDLLFALFQGVIIGAIVCKVYSR